MDTSNSNNDPEVQKELDTIRKDLGELRNTVGKPVALKDIPQGIGSRLDSDHVDGLNAFSAAHPSPNALVALDKNGQFPSSTIKSSFLLVMLAPF